MLTINQTPQVTYTGTLHRNSVLKAGFQHAREMTANDYYLGAHDFINAIKHLQKKTPRSDVFKVVQDTKQKNASRNAVILLRNGQPVYHEKRNSLGESCYNAIRNYVYRVLNKDVQNPAPNSWETVSKIDYQILLLKQEREQAVEVAKTEVFNKLNNLESKIN